MQLAGFNTHKLSKAGFSHPEKPRNLSYKQAKNHRNIAQSLAAATEEADKNKSWLGKVISLPFKLIKSLFGKSDTEKTEKFTEADIQRWKAGAKNFSSFLAKAKESIGSDLIEKLDGHTEDLEVIQALFLGENPYVFVPHGFEDLFKDSGFAVVRTNQLKKYYSSIAYKPEAIEKIIKSNLDVFGDRSPEQVLNEFYNSTKPSLDQLDKHRIAADLLRGYPQEAREDFVDFVRSEKEYHAAMAKLGISHAEAYDLKACQDMLSKIKNLKAEKRNDSSEALDKFKIYLEKSLLQLENLSHIQAPGIRWIPYGKITKAIKDKVERLKTAFEESGIEPKPKNIFSRSMLELGTEKIPKMQKLIKEIEAA